MFCSIFVLKDASDEAIQVNLIVLYERKYERYMATVVPQDGISVENGQDGCTSHGMRDNPLGSRVILSLAE